MSFRVIHKAAVVLWSKWCSSCGHCWCSIWLLYTACSIRILFEYSPLSMRRSRSPPILLTSCKLYSHIMRKRYITDPRPRYGAIKSSFLKLSSGNIPHNSSKQQDWCLSQSKNWRSLSRIHRSQCLTSGKEIVTSELPGSRFQGPCCRPAICPSSVTVPRWLARPCELHQVDSPTRTPLVLKAMPSTLHLITCNL